MQCTAQPCLDQGIAKQRHAKCQVSNDQRHQGRALQRARNRAAEDTCRKPSDHLVIPDSMCYPQSAIFEHSKKLVAASDHYEQHEHLTCSSQACHLQHRLVRGALPSWGRQVALAAVAADGFEATRRTAWQLPIRIGNGICKMESPKPQKTAKPTVHIHGQNERTPSTRARHCANSK